jgi:hypothetical protein
MSAVAKIEQPTLPAIPPEAPTMLDIISRAARDPDVDVDKLERLMAMAERTKAKDAEQAFNIAMGAAQTEIRRIKADKENGQTHSKYATYAALDRAVRPIYTRHGFALSFDTGEGAPDQTVRVICHVLHKDGHSRDYRADIPCDGKGAKGNDVMTKTHAVGSALSYGSRYLLKLIFNVAVGEDDDDGNAAGSELISADNLAELNGLMEKAKADPEKFAKYLKVDALAQLRLKDLPRAREALNLAIDQLEQKRRK